jgi:hypothetical protein
MRWLMAAACLVGMLFLASSAQSGSVCVSCWERVAGCESGHRWYISTGNGFYGGLQFTLSTWRGIGGSGYPHQASRWTQILLAERLRQRAGLSPWPACGRRYYG